MQTTKCHIPLLGMHDITKRCHRSHNYVNATDTKSLFPSLIQQKKFEKTKLSFSPSEGQMITIIFMFIIRVHGPSHGYFAQEIVVKHIPGVLHCELFTSESWKYFFYQAQQNNLFCAYAYSDLIVNSLPNVINNILLI